MKTRALRHATLFVLCFCTAAEAQRTATRQIEVFERNVRQAFSGVAARDIVAFVERYWRVPGNAGFDASIRRVVEVLEAAGYTQESAAGAQDRLTYRIERHPLSRATWEPVAATLRIVGQNAPLLEFETNRSLITAFSWSTPPGGVEAEVVDVGAGRPEDFEGIDVADRIVYGETSTARLFVEAVQRRGALGVLSYVDRAYNRMETHPNAIPFGSIPLDSTARSFGLRLSYSARETLKGALASGPVRVHVTTDTRIYPSEEMTLVADIRGATHPDERFVFSAHVQEPGANDNASGVGAQAEIARVLAEELTAGRFDPARSISMIWGDEVSSTRRYLEEDPARTEGIRWGLSLDMVGEDTEKTGGSFLIEKMPDPSAIWTRGEDQHTEWGGRPLSVEQLTPHYFNDFALNRCLDQAAGTGWVVKTNPYEGGSDHVPFLRANKPGLLFWHFTDVYYHTDRDRIEMVSAETLENVGVCAAASAMTLTTANGETARFIIGELESAANNRLATEAALSRDAITAGDDPAEQKQIVQAWIDWYVAAIRTAADIEVGGSSAETSRALDAAARRVADLGAGLIKSLERAPER